MRALPKYYICARYFTRQVASFRSIKYVMTLHGSLP